MQIETLTLWTADLDAQHAFYTDTLGLAAVHGGTSFRLIWPRERRWWSRTARRN